MSCDRGPGGWDERDELGRRVADNTRTRGSLAESELRAGRLETARKAFLRASNYWRTAGVMLMATAPLTSGCASLTRARPESLSSRARRCSCSHRKSSPLPMRGLRPCRAITSVPMASERPRPTVVLVGGYDGTAEEKLYFLNGCRGVGTWLQRSSPSTVPGQGAALLQQGLVLRPDFETVVGAVIDFPRRTSRHRRGKNWPDRSEPRSAPGPQGGKR